MSQVTAPAKFHTFVTRDLGRITNHNLANEFRVGGGEIVHPRDYESASANWTGSIAGASVWTRNPNMTLGAKPFKTPTRSERYRRGIPAMGLSRKS